MSTGGKLPAQYIVHASCPHWENGKRKEDEILKDVVFKAMQQATVKSVKSIAIPALGCGNYGFPLKVATEIIANAIKDFFREVQESTIMEVFFIDVIPVTVEAFTGAIKNVFDNVQTISQAHGNNDDDNDDDRGSYRPVPQPRRSIAQSGKFGCNRLCFVNFMHDSPKIRIYYFLENYFVCIQTKQHGNACFLYRYSFSMVLI